MRVAILDLGTNTFNLVIADAGNDAGFDIVLNKKLPVKLGEGRINQGEIIPIAYSRGIKAILEHYDSIQKLQAEKIMALGTSALRSAKNGEQFIQEILSKTGIQIQIISGDREAELIYLGVRQTVNLNQNIVLILDIGGGSNELILANKDQIFWKKSYPLGIARLLERFKPSNPMKSNEVQEIKAYLSAEMQDLFELTKKYQVKTLLGASGSFETFEAMIQASDDFVSEQALKAKSIPISIEDFDSLYEKLIHSSIEERRKMKGLEPMRIEMIVLACLLVKLLIDEIQLSNIIQSNFALKEGAIWELVNE